MGQVFRFDVVVGLAHDSGGGPLVRVPAEIPPKVLEHPQDVSVEGVGHHVGPGLDVPLDVIQVGDDLG